MTPDAVTPIDVSLYLDGGSLDVGLIRDSALNVTNSFQIFAESFEASAFLGPESYCLTLSDICPSGISSGQEGFLSCTGS